MGCEHLTREIKTEEAPRPRAAQLFRQGKTQAEVARELEVSRQSVSRWHADWMAGGTTALRGAGRAGRLPRLDDADLRRVERRLKKGPLASGYPTEMWTLQGVAEVIQSGHVWRILGQLGQSRQRPARRALERNDEAIAYWVKREWLRVKNARRRRASFCFQDESGFSLPPSVRATWAPRGQTPVLRHHFNWKRLSMSAAVGFASDGSNPWLVFNMRPGDYNDGSLIEFPRVCTRTWAATRSP
jgi:transposase